MGDFNYPRLADLGAAISGANKLLCQEVLEELDVRVLMEYPFTYSMLCMQIIFLCHLCTTSE
jgi:hypothetical protein